MLQKFELKGVHTSIDQNLQKYVTKKIANLDKYLPRHQRDSAHAIVELKEASKAQNQKKYTCEVILHLPQETLTVRESTMNMFAAIDIVEEKLKQQIKKYKDTHTNGKFFRHVSARLRRRTASGALAPETIEIEA